MIVARNGDVIGVAIKTVEGVPIQGEVMLKPLMAGEEMVMLELHYPKGAGSPPHSHDHESLCYVVKGTVRAVVEGETHTLRAGDACRHPRGVAHGIEALSDATVIEVKSPAQPLERFLGLAEQG
jgi:quercetin dioxygenase-like cupin family protein